MKKRRRFSFHICTPWGECQMTGFRINIRIPGRFIIVALNPDARVAHADGSSSWISVRRSP